MKKLFLAFFAFVLFSSCSLDEHNGPKFHYEILKVDSYVVPASFTLGESAPITVRYLKPTECHFFDGFYYEKDLNKRTIAVQTRVMQEETCLPLINEVVVKSFNFLPTSNGTYIFRFYKGVDANNIDVFEEVEIPVN
jgi:hypothetical protein